MNGPENTTILVIDPAGALGDLVRGVLAQPGRQNGSTRPSGRCSEGDAEDEVRCVRDVGEATEVIRQAIRRRRPCELALVAPSACDGWTTSDTDRLAQTDPNLSIVLCVPQGQSPPEVPAALVSSDQVLWVRWPLDPATLGQFLAVACRRRRLQDALDRCEAELGSTRRALVCAREEVAEAARAKSEFMANVSHEIRTPMNAILGFTGLLLSEPVSESQREKLEFVRTAGQTLLHAITHVLDFSKLATGEVRLQSVVFNLDDAIHGTVEEVLPAVRGKGLTFRCHIEETVPLWLRGDRVRFCQILANLLDNAVKFTERGSIHVRVTLDEESPAAATLRLMVTDTGVGIPSDRQSVIFDGFCQADGSSTRRFEGIGVGLAICRQLVTLMGGQIGLQSAAGQGSTFWFTATLDKLPHDKAQPDAASPRRTRTTLVTAARSAPGRRVVERPQILVAADDSLSRVLLEMLLNRSGCGVEAVSNGQEAVRVLKSRQYDLVFMDIDMPEVNGLEAMRQTRQHETTTGTHVPIVALTASALPGDREQCFAAGADRYVTKPFDADDLLALIREYFPTVPELAEQGAEGRLAPSPEGSPPEALADAATQAIRAMTSALDTADFGELEDQAGAVRDWAREAGRHPVADQAMRVQLAARRSDRECAAEALTQLRQLLSAESLAVSETP